MKLPSGIQKTAYSKHFSPKIRHWKQTETGKTTGNKIQTSKQLHIMRRFSRKTFQTYFLASVGKNVSTLILMSSHKYHPTL